MRNGNDPIARLTYVAGLIREGLQVADEQDEYVIAAKLDEALACVRDRIDRLKQAN